MSSSKRIVSKFGGSSMADAEAMHRSAAIVAKQNSSVVVVSATYGTTNLLVEAAEKSGGGDFSVIRPIIDQIVEKHNAIAADLKISNEARKDLEALYEELGTLLELLVSKSRAAGEMLPGSGSDPSRKPYSDEESGDNPDREKILELQDSLFGIGERMSSRLFTECLSSIGVTAGYFDAATILRTDNRFSRATPDFSAIEPLAGAHLEPLIAGDERPTIVTQGFIGSTESGIRTTLGRGGSDYSAAIFAWALNADVLEIWTDVGGVATTDPRIAPNAKPISELSFQEAAEMATFGAKILHPSTLIPAIWRDIPVYVGSSINPDEGGTWIYRNVGQAPLIRALTIRRKQSLLTITTPDMLNTYGFLYRVFKVFNDHKVSVDSITTSEISVAMTVDDATLDDRKMLGDLEKLGQLNIEKSFELVSVIGNNINHTAGLARVVFKALSDMNVRMIGQGASKHNFCFLVDEGSGEVAVKRLHAALIESGDFV
ncbi:lysine-sensitive aspartokinase 3 [Balneolales bacterium ANBcel1]|nr:lysine-sensitive aspartokinase 3 [Balneolales bacterium ANBcel1]